MKFLLNREIGGVKNRFEAIVGRSGLVCAVVCGWHGISCDGDVRAEIFRVGGDCDMVVPIREPCGGV